MRYYKIISDGYIMAIGTGNGNIEITENEYNAILTEISNIPIAQQGYDYKLKEDLTLELCEVPMVEITEEYQEAVS
jgi:hypothetical protein